ncbi:LysE family translocator [Pseudonocardia acaciae]|uniref:LysE family translocator n=1 Tax=Pseudonocardia acaciae TaxID=551276 RepID=UPI00048B08A1|nr:LysE family translocator [Pseudonocardia acaciae]
MPSTNHLLAFAVASVVLALIPGPSLLFVVSRAIAHGRRAALGSVAGNSTGAAALVVLVAVGLGSAVERSLALYTAIKLVGAVYLVYLGIRTFRERRALADVLGDGEAVGVGRHVYWQGVLVGATNPKTMVFFAAVLPQFVDPTAGGVPMQMIVLGLMFVLIATASDSVWGLLAGGVRDWLARSPRRAAALGGAGGLSMIGLGLGLAVTGRRD